MERRRKHWGWGYVDEQPSPEDLRGAAAYLTGQLGLARSNREQPVPLSQIELPAPQLAPPPALESICTTNDYERALHCYGRSYPDVVRAFRGRFDHPPDVVVHPRDERDVQAALDWALSAGAAVIPFGGGTSVVGGVEAGAGCEKHAGVVTIDLKALDRLLEVDPVSLSACIQAGATGPVLEDQLAQHGLTLRHFPQSFQFSTLCRLIDAREAHVTGAGDGSHALLVLGFESAEHDVEPWMATALECCADHGGAWERGSAGDASRGALGSWREAFLRAPYLRDAFITIGVLSETFESAITWDRFAEFHEAVLARVSEAVREVCGAGTVTCRFTHVYADGPAPYYTILAPARRGGELEQWAQIKRTASEAVIAGGGTITHHHAVGREHRPWYDRQRPEPFAVALRAAKAAVDPHGALNPGVLIDP